MSIRVLLCLIRAIALLAPVRAAPPNIVFMLADDLGYANLSCYGATGIRTPHIDRLAAHGVRFTQFYSNGPECTPTRAALLTGRYQQRLGGLECAIGTGNVGRYDDAIRLAGQRDLGLPPVAATLPHQLRQAGYATALIGKWHLGYEDKFSPNLCGFDHAFYCLGGGMDYFHHTEDGPEPAPVLRLNGKPVTREGYFTDLIAEEALRWLDQSRSQPFFLYLPFTAPHSPFQGPGEKEPQPLPAHSERWQQSKAPPEVYTAMVESLDEAAGRVLEKLDQLAIANNTLVIFTSDNGGTKSARPTGFRGIKGSTFEGGIRVPCLVRWPGVVKPGSTWAHPALTFDLTASCLSAAAVSGDPAPPLDGIGILQHIAKSSTPADRALFWRQRRGNRTWWAVRDGPLKLVAEQNGSERHEFLFDIAADPAEARDLLVSHPDDAQRLRAKLAGWEAEVQPSR